MPHGSPFTALCQTLAALADGRRADLHVHTTASDGAYTPSQVVALAARERLAAVAVTDHDTTAAVTEAVAAACGLPGRRVEVVAGVEITTTYAGRELHLLGYFVDPDHVGLSTALRDAAERRRDRFRRFLAALAADGVNVSADVVRQVEATAVSLGRPHVSDVLIRSGLATTRYSAWQRFVGPLSPRVPAGDRPTVETAIALVRAAGGASSLAHPPASLEDADFEHLTDAGLDGLEIVYPWGRTSPAARLRGLAARLDLLTTGGSDCHGPDAARRDVGRCAIGGGDLDRLRERATRRRAVTA